MHVSSPLLAWAEREKDENSMDEVERVKRTVCLSTTHGCCATLLLEEEYQKVC